ncbi:MAG: leucyl/phenylalanyl-tRNA--protein transferase [Verrucomicrobiales bacterium]|nr:leucyl/phenylalanyl-tRNA--protein transferase [Verrucomicrobiales bacterium]
MPRRPVRLEGDDGFPDPRGAVVGGPYAGLVAIGGDLSVERLCLAYRSGLFPWTFDPVTWWSPDPRGIFELGSLHVSRSLRRTLRQAKYRVTRNAAFREVITACATVRRPGGWIVPEFVEAYTALHRAGHAHSVECWSGDRLVGGVYGVSVGGLFAGESMFHKASDASKVALVHLHDHLVSRGYGLFDIQMVTEVTGSLGAREIPRDEYLARLAEAVARPVRFA